MTECACNVAADWQAARNGSSRQAAQAGSLAAGDMGIRVNVQVTQQASDWPRLTP